MNHSCYTAYKEKDHSWGLKQVFHELLSCLNHIIIVSQFSLCLFIGKEKNRDTSVFVIQYISRALWGELTQMNRNSEKMKTAVLTLCLFFLCAAAFPQMDGQASESAGTNKQLFLILRQLESKLNNAEKQLADLKSSIQGKNITQLEVLF